LNAERRFVLILVCACLALATLGMAMRYAHQPVAEARTSDRATVIDATAIANDLAVSSPLASLLAPPEERLTALRLARPRVPTVLDANQIVSYYGNAYTADMGILGSADPGTVADLLEEHAARYDELNGAQSVIPALHLVSAVAQPHPTDNGLYLQYLDEATLQAFIELTRERNMLLFLDLQIGWSNVAEEVEKALPYLREPHVHLALDPEFAMTPPEIPGEHLGSLRGADVEVAQRMLQGLVDRERLPPKLLVVHEFDESMLTATTAITEYPSVQLVIDMDGFGPAEIKRVKYQDYASRPYAQRAAIKLFFDHDPDLLTDADVLTLDPLPAIVIYQ
jgi:hypothetical protein